MITLSNNNNEGNNQLVRCIHHSGQADRQAKTDSETLLAEPCGCVVVLVGMTYPVGRLLQVVDKEPEHHTTCCP